MIRLFKEAVKKCIGVTGYEIRFVKEYGSDPVGDIVKLTKLEGRADHPVIFDVGANVGKLVQRFHESFTGASIHAFEPSGDTFNRLTAATAHIPNLTLNFCAMGSAAGELVLLENEHSDMSSLLPPDKHCWGEIKSQTKVAVRTIDEYCSEKGIDRIDVLKIDTQGYDLEVIRGAERMIREGRVRTLYMEIILSEMYKGIPRLDEVYSHLHTRGFRLVTFYQFSYQDNRASGTDALFTYRD